MDNEGHIMTAIQEVRQLLKTIKTCRKRIEKIENSCKHNRIRHKLFPDVYMGQGGSSTCLDCGKFLSCFSAPASKIETKTWVETTV